MASELATAQHKAQRARAYVEKCQAQRHFERQAEQRRRQAEKEAQRVSELVQKREREHKERMGVGSFLLSADRLTIEQKRMND